jgi:hypothetical protein
MTQWTHVAKLKAAGAMLLEKRRARHWWACVPEPLDVAAMLRDLVADFDGGPLPPDSELVRVAMETAHEVRRIRNRALLLSGRRSRQSKA